MTTTLDLLKEARDLLAHSRAYIDATPHGDNCFVSSHYEGDPGDGCNCGKESLTDAFFNDGDDLIARLDAHLARESAQPNSRVVNDPLTTDVARWLAEKRFGPQHIGLGDIRLTIGDQEELLTMIAPTCKPDLHVCQPNPQPAPAVPTGWYACSERLPVLPADEEPVPVYTWDGLRVDEDEWSSQYDQPAGPVIGGWVRDGDWFDKDPSQQVTHWMPRNMPTPPKGE